MSLRWRMGLVALFGLAVGLAASFSDRAAAADDKKMSYAQARKTFETLKTQAQKPGVASRGESHWKTLKFNDKAGKPVDVKVWRGPAPRLSPVDPDMGTGPMEPVSLAVKVWAELSDPQGTHTGQFVNIELYKWKPEQRFYFWVESAIPIQLSLFQNFDVGAAASKPPKLVSPDPAFPLTYTTCVPGEKFCFPQLFMTDKDLRDEFVTLTVFAAGDKVTVPSPSGMGNVVLETPLNNNSNVNVNNNTLQVTTQVINQNLNPGPVDLGGAGSRSPKFRNKGAEAARLSAVNPEGSMATPATPATPTTPSSPGAAPSGDYNQVTMFALGNQTVGHLPLRFSK